MQETAIKTASQIRQEFFDFFQARHGHIFVSSSPVVPHDDPTLLFTNAGMNQFKDVFLGHGRRDYTRAVNTQKCIRAGGKHNDLEDVGKDLYHHTFFEMLGNWSFGDYFKAEAIEWAWDLLVNVWGLDPDRLYATVFAGEASEGTEPDLEAERLWQRHLPADRISRWGKKDNFWEMGESGPCGPCSEIHYDGRGDGERARTPGAELINAENPDVIEIWNLVFIQFNRGEDGTLTNLPARHVDTGMGFERVVRVIQGKQSNYDIDIWQPIFAAIREHTGAPQYRGKIDDRIDMAYRVIADHVRCLTMAITDGAVPGNDGRGYVLRRILRRAVRLARQTLGVKGPLLCDLVPSVVRSLGDAFPELKKDPFRIVSMIRDEEESFLRTLDRGLDLFEQAAGRAEASGASRIPADDAFMLHDTYGFPIDLTRIMAEERGLSVDEEGYERLMVRAREISRKTHEPVMGMTLPSDAIAKLRYKKVKPTADADKYHGRPRNGQIEAIWNGKDFDDVAHVGAEVGIILNRTNHYAEAGGQIGDRGMILADVFDVGTIDARGYGGTAPTGDGRFEVADTQQFGDYIVHIGRVVDGKLRVGEKVKVAVDLNRRVPTLANHTGTHLLNHALRAVLGEDVNQRGSLVASDRLRFDFTCSHAMTHDQIERVETLVNEAITAKLTVYDDTVPLEIARQIHGLRAVFGERYPDIVRVVSIGKPVAELVADPSSERWHDYSVELCGGTHLKSSDEAGRLVIVHEQALAAGVRRITALTGPPAIAAQMTAENLQKEVQEAAALDDGALADRFDELAGQFEHLTMSAVAKHAIAPLIEPLRQRMRGFRKQEHSSAREQVVRQAREIVEEAGEAPIIVARLDGADKDTLLNALDVLKAKRPESATMLLAPDEKAGKVAIAAFVPAKLIEMGLKAGDWVREAARECGGGGGGRPDQAQAGGKDPSKVGRAMVVARDFAEKTLGE